MKKKKKNEDEESEDESIMGYDLSQFELNDDFADIATINEKPKKTTKRK